MANDLTDATCPFCRLETERVLEENELAAAFADAFPVSAGHTLVIPRRHLADFFELSQAEVAAVAELLFRMQKRLLAEQNPAGFNIGVNVGAADGNARSCPSDSALCRGHGGAARRRSALAAGQGALPLRAWVRGRRSGGRRCTVPRQHHFANRWPVLGVRPRAHSYKIARVAPQLLGVYEVATVRFLQTAVGRFAKPLRTSCKVGGAHAAAVVADGEQIQATEKFGIEK